MIKQKCVLFDIKKLTPGFYSGYMSISYSVSPTTQYTKYISNNDDCIRLFNYLIDKYEISNLPKALQEIGKINSEVAEYLNLKYLI